MRARRKGDSEPTGWGPIADPEGKFSTGIGDFDRLLGGGFQRGSMALFHTDPTIGLEDLDLILFPTLLNSLYLSRGMIAVLPSRDAPHAFRSRLTRYVTRRRFDSRVRICDYVGEDEGLSYVVNLRDPKSDPIEMKHGGKEKQRAIAKMEAAEKAAQGIRGKPFLELVAFEVLDTLMGTEMALKMLYYGTKRTRHVGNLAIGILGSGLGCEAGVQRMADTEFSLHRDDVGLVVRGIRPAFSSFVVTTDMNLGAPHVAFVPRPP